LKTAIPLDNVGRMSVKQCIWVLHPVDIEAYLEVLKSEYGARDNKNQPGSFLVGDPTLPFYVPQSMEGKVAVTGFNHRPLPHQLIDALVNHPELAPSSALIRWTEEQELLVEVTVEKLRQRAGKERR
jgi:hypothetical protein